MFNSDSSQNASSLNISSSESRKEPIEGPDEVQKCRRIPKPGAGIWLDLQEKVPYYWQDWRDSWDYRVIPSALNTYFNNLLPALAFAQDMFDKTHNSYGVNEVLLATGLGGVVFGALAGQPLCIVSVTGPIAIFSYTIYEIIKPLKTNYFGFMFWVYIWSMILHLIMAFSNTVALLQYVTAFPCDIFGLFNNIIYIEKGIQILTRQFYNEEGREDLTAGFASVTVALCMSIFGLTFKNLTRTTLLTHRLRIFISDYSTPLSVLFWSAFTHFGGFLDGVHFQKLPITKSFYPTNEVDRNGSTWLAYQKIPVKDVFIALPFGIILTLLFYFDHNVSSLMAQRSEYKLKKNSSFHYDFALLGITTGISGVVGIPAPNGLIPQAPLHTESLLVHDENGKVIRCVEQRFTNTAQGLMAIGTMTRPLLICLGQIPQAVLSGLFFIMGIEGLLHNEIIARILCLFTETKKRDPQSILNHISRKKLVIFLCFSLAGFVGEFAITNTIAAIGFPLILLLTVLIRMVFPKIFTKEELDVLDHNATEEFTVKNLLLDNLCALNSSSGSEASQQNKSEA